jgi:hypothetical protein
MTLRKPKTIKAPAARLLQDETSQQAKINLNLFDGTRQPIAASTEASEDQFFVCRLNNSPRKIESA